jgi:glycosyltransferase involved in cell wall biosynthesis
LKALADELGIAEQLAWLPFRDDMAAVMRAFDIFALPSREEGFGIVLLEAMACELPVVACCIDAIPEIIADGETGLLVPARDSDRMAEALERLVTDPAARARLGGSGRNRVESSFTIEAMQKKTLAIYAELEVAPR